MNGEKQIVKNCRERRWWDRIVEKRRLEGSKTVLCGETVAWVEYRRGGEKKGNETDV